MFAQFKLGASSAAAETLEIEDYLYRAELWNALKWDEKDVHSQDLPSLSHSLKAHKPPYLYVEALDEQDFPIKILFDTTGRLLLHTIPDCMLPDLFWESSSLALLGHTFVPQHPEYYD